MLTGRERPIVSVVSTCKGRYDNLKKSFAALCDVDFGGNIEYVVVDYNCPDGTFEKVQSWDLPEHISLTLHKVQHVEYFHPSHARNVGAFGSAAKALLFVDADTLLTQAWVDKAVRPVLDGNCQYSHVVLEAAATEKFGTLCVLYDVYKYVRGYDEAIRNWGKEDEDMYRRLKHVGFTGVCVPHENIDVIRHGNDDRVRFYEDKRIAAYGKPRSNDDNARLIYDPGRAVNTGDFGIAETLTFIKWRAWAPV